MATEIKVPTLGESVTEATIGQWFKKPGEAVAADEPLVELETDKVTVEVPSPVAGTLSEIVAADGETVEVGALLGSVAEGDGAASAPASAPTPEAAPAAAPAAAAPSPAKANGSDMPPAPSAAKMLEEKG
ncbi:MAG: biotin/lipoyl-containing protein, partial [Pseudomonadota bacterium]